MKNKADIGWCENANGSISRCQNPHMHLLKASTEVFSNSNDHRFLKISHECIFLFKHVFFRDGVWVQEFFNEDWSLVQSDAQVVEPGHMAEWIYLIHRYEKVTGEEAKIDLRRMFDQVLLTRDAFGLLPNRYPNTTQTCRFGHKLNFSR